MICAAQDKKKLSLSLKRKKTSVRKRLCNLTRQRMPRFRDTSHKLYTRNLLSLYVRLGIYERMMFSRAAPSGSCTIVWLCKIVGAIYFHRTHRDDAFRGTLHSLISDRVLGPRALIRSGTTFFVFMYAATPR